MTKVPLAALDNSFDDLFTLDEHREIEQMTASEVFQPTIFRKKNHSRNITNHLNGFV